MENDRTQDFAKHAVFWTGIGRVFIRENSDKKV